MNHRQTAEQTNVRDLRCRRLCDRPQQHLAAAIPFWERLGFTRTGGDDEYIIVTGWGCEVHLTQAGTGAWRVPEKNNHFGIFIRTPNVDAIAARVDDLIIRPDGVLRHREWGAYMNSASPVPRACSSASAALPIAAKQMIAGGSDGNSKLTHYPASP